MNKISSTKKWKPLKQKQNQTNPRAEKYNDWTKEFNRELQNQTQPEERINGPEKRTFEIIQSEDHTEKGMKKSEENL